MEASLCWPCHTSLSDTGAVAASLMPVSSGTMLILCGLHVDQSLLDVIEVYRGVPIVRETDASQLGV